MSPATGKPPEIIVIVLIDTLRADCLGAYGHTGGLTPTLDAFAREGVLFESAESVAPWTLPSIASLFCGVYPDVHQCDDYGGPAPTGGAAAQVRVLDDRFVTLAEALQAGGYETAAFVANPFLAPRNGFSQGFDHYDVDFATNEVSGFAVNDHALTWLKSRQSKRPLFVYLHYMDVHDPYRSSIDRLELLLKRVEALSQPRRLSEIEKTRHARLFAKCMAEFSEDPRHEKLAEFAEYWRARYEAGVSEADACIGALRKGLQELGLLDKSLLVVTADHGEALGEHRYWSHGFSAHEDQLHVPLIVRWPGRLPAGKRIAERVQMFDLNPTLLSWAGAPQPGHMQAQSLIPLINGETPSPRAILGEAVKEHPSQRALFTDSWKLLADTQAEEYELFDLSKDPIEQTNLAASQMQRVTEMRRRLNHVVADNYKHPLFAKAKVAGLSAGEIKRLVAIGYLDASAEESPSTSSAPATP